MTLIVQNLDVSLGSTLIVKRAALSLAASGMAILIGPNGAGKSTLLKAIAGLLPASGEIRLDGTLLSPNERQIRIAYMPQDIGPTSSLTILEVVLLGRIRSLGFSVPASLCDEALEILAQFGLSDLQSRTLDTVSGGQRQMVYLAQALFRKPRVLLLDEPTAALDLRHQMMVLEAVQAHCAGHGTIALAAMHDLTLASRFARQMTCIAAGCIEADGLPKDVLTEDRMRRIYGVETEIHGDTNGFVNVIPLRAT